MIVTVNSLEPPEPALPLRQRKKLQAMRRAQATAIKLFEERGFAGVSIEEIAAAADLSPASLYRYFGTKENLAVWDEDDPAFLERLERRLAASPPFEAFVAAITDALAPLLAAEYEVRSARLRLIFSEKALLSARREESRLFAREVANTFARARGSLIPSMRDTAAAAAAAALLEVALEHWAAQRGAVPIQRAVRDAFACLQ